MLFEDQSTGGSPKRESKPKVCVEPEALVEVFNRPPGWLEFEVSFDTDPRSSHAAQLLASVHYSNTASDSQVTVQNILIILILNLNPGTQHCTQWHCDDHAFAACDSHSEHRFGLQSQLKTKSQTSQSSWHTIGPNDAVPYAKWEESGSER